MESEGIPFSQAERLGTGRFRPGQCWRLYRSMPLFAQTVILLAQGRTSSGMQFWEVAVPRAEQEKFLFPHLYEALERPPFQSISETDREGGNLVGEPAGVLLGVPESALEASVNDLIAEGLDPAEVRLRMRLPSRVHFIEGTLEEGLQELAAAWRWEAEQRQSARPENFLQAVHLGDADAVLRMVSEQPELLNTYLPTAPPGPPLCEAIRSGRMEIVRCLLDQGADVNLPDEEGLRPLHLAAELGHGEIVSLLVARGADLRRQNPRGETPLMAAARSLAWEAPQAAQMLLDVGAEPDLNSLVALGRVQQAQELLEHMPGGPASAPQPDRLIEDALLAIRRAIGRRMTPGILEPEVLDAIMEEYLPLMEDLLRRGVDPNRGFPLWTAVQLPDARPAELLLRWGADPNLKIEENKFPLEVARTPAIQELLRRYGAKRADDPEVVVRRETERLARCPEDTEAYKHRAEAWTRLGRYEEALADWAALLELAPEDPEGYLGRAWIWAACPDERFRDGSAAISAARRAIDLAGGLETLAKDRVWDEKAGHVSVRTEYWETLAAALAEVGRFDEAVQVMDQVLAIASAADRPRLRYRRALFADQQPYRIEPVEREQARYAAFAEESPRPADFWTKVWKVLVRIWPPLRRCGAEGKSSSEKGVSSENG